MTAPTRCSRSSNSTWRCIDSIDNTCGNQGFFTADAGLRYSTLAGVLANDALWVNTGSTTCTTYLGVEANATGALTNTDCGGRGLAYDVMNITYNLLVTGGLTAPTTPLDGTTAVAAKTNGTTFPYLGAPYPGLTCRGRCR